MPRYELSQRRKAEKDVQRRWELPARSHVWCYLRHSPGDNQTIDSQRSGMAEWCASNAWLVDCTFVDEAIEGSREDRDQFQSHALPRAPGAAPSGRYRLMVLLALCS
jgi:hypothetical protein